MCLPIIEDKNLRFDIPFTEEEMMDMRKKQLVKVEAAPRPFDGLSMIGTCIINMSCR